MEEPLKINFGCGSNRIEGWQNYDIDCDVTKLPLPFDDASATQILAEHLGEHLDSAQLLGFLTDCHRILQVGGVLRLCCPVVGIWLGRKKAIDLAINHGHRQILTEETMRTFLWMAGFNTESIRRTDRKPNDGHYRVIGLVSDELETCRMECVK